MSQPKAPPPEAPKELWRQAEAVLRRKPPAESYDRWCFLEPVRARWGHHARGTAGVVEIITRETEELIETLSQAAYVNRLADERYLA